MFEDDYMIVSSYSFFSPYSTLYHIVNCHIVLKKFKNKTRTAKKLQTKMERRVMMHRLNELW